ncbi:MAG: hypothetical protein RLZZ324_3 [Candidatus Parcubacteria bacterium]|jgi:hypothetical protein
MTRKQAHYTVLTVFVLIAIHALLELTRIVVDAQHTYGGPDFGFLMAYGMLMAAPYLLYSAWVGDSWQRPEPLRVRK